MNQQWKAFSDRFDALSYRERVIVFGAVFLLAFFISYTYIFQPLIAKQKILVERNKTDQVQLVVLQSDFDVATGLQAKDPDAETKAKIAELLERRRALDESMQAMQESLVRPEKMDSLLETVLRRNQGLQLISLKNLPVVNLMEIPLTEPESAPSSLTSSSISANIGAVTLAPAKKIEVKKDSKAPDEKSLYKHEFEIVLQGNYVDILNYVRQLEAMPERVYWSRGTLKVNEYPKATLSLNLFTLSLEKTWLSL